MASQHVLTNNLLFKQGVLTQNASTTIYGTELDALGYEIATLSINLGTLGAGNLVAVKVTECATSGGVFADVTSATTGNIGPAAAVHEINVNLSERERYLKAVVTVGSGSGGYMGATWILGRGRKLPPTQDNTVVIV